MSPPSTPATCNELYPDLHDGSGTDTGARRDPKNLARHRLYGAVLHLFKLHFDIAPARLGPTEARQDPNGDWSVSYALKPWEFPGAADTLTLGEKVRFLAVYGRLTAENRDDPSFGKGHLGRAGSSETFLVLPDLINLSPDDRGRVRVVQGFVTAFVEAVERYFANKSLYEKVYTVLLERGKAPSASGDTQTATVFAAQLSTVVDRLAEQKVGPDHPQLRVIIDNAISQAVAGGTQGKASAIDIDLPDLEEQASVSILDHNVRSLAVVYFAAQLEDARYFTVADKVVEQFGAGMLPISRGSAGDNLYEFLRNSHLRFTEVDRRGMYARAFGFAQGGVEEALPNRDFGDLWIRALSAVSAYARQVQGMPTFTGQKGENMYFNVNSQPIRVNPSQVHKALQDLAVNLSLHGYGMAHFAAVELQDTVKKVLGMLSHPDVLSAYGVRDPFQLIERVAQSFLNSSVNTMGQRVKAQSGSRIIQWLADRSAVLSAPVTPSQAILSEPELVNNVEKWLAVTGTIDATVDQYSEPVAVRSQPTIPSMSLGTVPDALKNVLDAAGAATRGLPSV